MSQPATTLKTLCLLPVFLLTAFLGFSNDHKGTMFYTISMESPASKSFHVTLLCRGVKKESLTFKIPAWSPGYYQLLNYSRQLSNFTAAADGKPVKVTAGSLNDWKVETNKQSNIAISYDVTVTSQFVAQSWIDEEHAYIIPAATFLYIDSMKDLPVQLTVQPYKTWTNVATGLDSVAGKKFTYTAPDLDILFDCPILIGNLQELPPFTVKGIPHRFIGYKMGNFDGHQLMSDLKKIVETSVELIGDIPYKHYTFLAIGPGQGGIEHLNSTTISFDGSALNSREGRVRIWSFIAHEYFHHYNVKRIRPIELGPFDYDRGNRTKMLWVSEGLSVYYEYLVLKRAGLITTEELLQALENNLKNYENKPGHLYQSVAQASYETWSDGPFGRTGDEVNKTISYYDKGPVLGLLLDFKIRSATKNNRSLDDVMRKLYNDYYKKLGRGFTETELRAVCETIAGTKLDEFFDYIYTVKELNYKKYLGYGGLSIDTTAKALPGNWLGIAVRERNDSLQVMSVDWASPAWEAGIRAGDKVVQLDHVKVSRAQFIEFIKDKKPGEKIKLSLLQKSNIIDKDIFLSTRMERPFTITALPGATTLQQLIFKSWIGEK